MAKILVIGAGVVGQATGKGLATIDHEVTFKDVQSQREAELQAEGFATWSSNPVCNPDFIFLSVGTPTRDGAVDLTYLRAACNEVGDMLHNATNHPVVVVRCTVPPGTTESLIIPWLERASGQIAGRHFGVCYNPEFLRAVSAVEDFVNPWLVVIGRRDRESARRLADALEPLTRRDNVPVHITDLKTAELAKYASNLYNATKISFTNEMWLACRDLGLDGDSVMRIVARSAEGMWNAQYGTRGGFPYGGVCLPKDTTGFLSFARSHGIQMPLLESVIEVNDRIEHTEHAEPVPASSNGNGNGHNGHRNGHVPEYLMVRSA